jgi:hypothetical protein
LIDDKTSELTPCTVFSAEQTNHRHECVRRLQQKIVGRYSSLLDPMAGSGVDAAMFNAPITLVNDLDPACGAILKQKFSRVTDFDFFDPNQRRDLYSLIKPDLIELDFNNFTLAKWHGGKYKPEMEDTLKTARKFLILNDCSSFGLRMWGKRDDYRKYSQYSEILGQEIKSVDEYRAALPTFWHRVYPDWEVAAEETFFHASPKGNGGTTYVLFACRRTLWD